MSKNRLFLHNLSVKLPISLAELQLYGAQLMAAANALPSLPFHSVSGMADDLHSALSRLAMLSAYPYAASTDSKGRIVGISLMRIRDDQQTVISD